MFGINTIVPTLAAISTFATITKLGIPMPSPEACFLLIAVWNVLGLFSKPSSEWLKIVRPDWLIENFSKLHNCV